MTIINELEEAFNEVFVNSNESEEFKRRFKKLISIALENSNHSAYSNEDFKEVMELINLKEEV